MIRKIVVTTSLSALLFGTPAMINGKTQEPREQQQQPQQTTKSINGKITEIGDQGHSFTLDTVAGDKQTLKFVVDKNTQVQGQVKVGTMVAVDYQPTDSGQLLCVRVAAQG